jgi:hypothetical protein
MQFEEWASENLKDRYLSLIKRIEEKKLADKCTIPFVPYRGSAYGDDNKPKILIIGKATYGWGKGEKGQGSGTLNAVLGRDDLWDHLSKLSEEFIEDEIIPFYGGKKGHYHSNFWNRIYRLIGQCLYGYQVLESGKYERDRRRSEKCFRSIAWSNVFKVGALKSEGGNPNKDLISIQKDVNTLEEEIRVLQPNVVIFSTGPNYDEHIKAFLKRPMKVPKNLDPELGVKEIKDLGCLAFRTYHFQSRSNQDFKQVVNYICGRMNETVT